MLGMVRFLTSKNKNIMELNRQETDEWNAEIEKIVGVGLTMLQRVELSNYFKSEVKKLTLTDVVSS